MNYIKILRSVLSAGMVLLAGTAISCADDIKIGSVDEGKYSSFEEVYGYVHNVKGTAKRIVDLYKGGAIVPVAAGITKNAEFGVDVEFTIDAAALESYNAANDSNFPLFPVSLVTFENNGKVVIPPGSKVSDHLNISLAYDEADPQFEGKSYALPVAIKSVTEGVELTDAQKSYIFFVKPQGNRLNAEKPNGLKVVSCMEVNDTNPLNNGEFFLQNSGKPLIDVVILFSGNINYNAETGRVYVSLNQNVRALLENREKYLVPLQNMGIKILMGILGNGDQSGVGNLQQETAQHFAQELKAYCDAYELDGVFYDDEYSKYAAMPGLDGSSSNAAASRLVFESKKAMPDKLVTVYIYHATQYLVAVDGVQPGDYIDYAIADYGDNAPTGNYPGSVKSQMMPYSMEFNRGYWTQNSTLTSIRTGGFGGIMIFAMDNTRGNWSTQHSYMRNIATYMFEDTLVYTGVEHKKDWL